MSRKKALIHIGGGPLQLPSIKWAKEIGLHVIVTDRNLKAPGSALADHFKLISGNDVQALLRLASQINNEYELVGAWASSDFGLPAVAAIAKKFHLPGCSQLAVEQALDKSKAKDMWRQKGIPTPNGEVVNDYRSLLSAVDEYSLPVILKPTDSCGSQGVRSVWNIEDLQTAYMTAQGFSKDVLIEQIVNGQHIDVNGLFLEGNFIPCGTMDRFFSGPPYHYPIWGCQPSSLSEAQQAAVYKLVERAARTLGIEAGPVKADTVWTDEGPIILELAPRFHGDVSTAHITPMATSNSPIKEWMSYLAGMKCSLKDRYRKINRFAGWMALFPQTYGALSAVNCIEDAYAIEGVQEVFIAKQPGAIIKKHIDNSSVCGFVWATSKTHRELLDILTRARSSIEYVTHKT